MRLAVAALIPALAATLLAGCASSPDERALRDLADAPALTAVPFFPQDDFQCGPAALATVLAHGGVAVTPQQLTPQLFVPGRRGSLQAELLAATRRHGRVPYLLAQTPTALLEAVRAELPVLLLQDLGLAKWPVWHYAVLVGFDADAQSFLLRSGTRPRHTLSARRFLRSWARAGRWAMVAVAPSEPPAGADARAWLRAVAPFESTGDLELAAEGYLAAVDRWPDDALVWTALGNVRYLQEDPGAAARAYGRALALAPEHWIARNNLVHTFIAMGCADRAQRWTRGVSPPSAFAAAWGDTLQALASAPAGNCTAAVSSLRAPPVSPALHAAPPDAPRPAPRTRP